MRNKIKYKIIGINSYLSSNALLKISLLFFGIIIAQTASANLYSSAGLIMNESNDSTPGIAIHFPVNQTRLLRNFSDNALALNRLDNILYEKFSSFDVDSIVVYGYASPEGSITHNLELAAGRAQAVKSYIAQRLPRINRNKIITRSQLVDWQALNDIVADDWSIPFRDEVEMVLKIQDITDIRRFRFLKSIGNGAALNYITQNYSVPLRRASSVLFYGSLKESPKPEVKVEEQVIIVKDTVYYERDERIDTLYVNNYEQIKQPLFAVKTNLLFDLATALNVEIEVPIGERWSILGEVIFPWWLWESKQYALQTLSFNLEGRYWFGDRTDRPVLTGWFVGGYGGGGYYDIEWGSKGYQGEFFIATGLSGGFSHTLGKSGNFRMEYSLGVGYLRTNYREYTPLFGIDDEWHLIRQRSGNYTWIGPTRIKVSLSWILNYNSYKTKK
ncbi:MAG: DUF3575 domain-containing protein [Bacteroidales bacterium]|nr:DUF3575 domain-containing protein [Bacteroidales bacterium]